MATAVGGTVSVIPMTALGQKTYRHPPPQSLPSFLSHSGEQQEKLSSHTLDTTTTQSNHVFMFLFWKETNILPVVT